MKSLRCLAFALVLPAASCSGPVISVKVPKKSPALPLGATLSFEHRLLREGGMSVGDYAPSFTIAATRKEKAGDDGAIEYSSSDLEKATVDKKTGAVTIVGNESGEVTITATKKATAKFAESKATYRIFIKPGVKLSYSQKIAALGNVSANDTHTEGLTKSIEIAHTSIITYVLTEVKDENGNVVTDASADAVVTIDAETGKLTLRKTGEATVTATKPAGQGFKKSTASYTATFTVPAA